jgi:hypothetical protein
VVRHRESALRVRCMLAVARTALAAQQYAVVVGRIVAGNAWRTLGSLALVPFGMRMADARIVRVAYSRDCCLECSRRKVLDPWEGRWRIPLYCFLRCSTAISLALADRCPSSRVI